MRRRSAVEEARSRVAEAASLFSEANQPSPEQRRRVSGDAALVAKPSRGERRKRKEKAKSEELQALKSTDPVLFNLGAEEKFVKLIARLASRESLSVATAIQEASFELKVSIETAKRYLIKHTARRAEFVIEENTVKLRGG